MDTMVSARIGVEKHRRASDLLNHIHSTPTQLINAAYDYLIETGELPMPPRAGKSRLDKLGADECERLRKSIAATTFAVPPSYFEGRTDAQLLERALKTRHGMGRS